MLLTALVVPNFTNAETISSDDKREAIQNKLVELSHNRNPDILGELDVIDQQEIIKNSVAWIVNSQLDSGRFNYEYLPYLDKYTDDDNIVRQAGTLYSLAMTARRDVDNKYDLEPTIRKSLEYLESISESGEFNDRDFLCVLDRRLGDKCKLGATALTLAAMMESFQAYPELESDYQDLAKEYKEYLLAVRNPDAGFRGYFNPKPNGLQTSKESSFFNGETLLALTMYQQYKPESEIESTIKEVFTYVLTTADRDPGLYLWAMASVNLLDQHYSDSRYLPYIRLYVGERLATARAKSQSVSNYCAYTEGLASASVMMSRHLDDADMSFYTDNLNTALSKNATLQITSDDIVRMSIVPELDFLSINNPEQAIGGFLTGQNDLMQRIDYTQHCLSAYVINLVDLNGQSL